MFVNLELYAKVFPHSWEAEQFRAGEYDLASFTPAILHPAYIPKTSHSYAKVAGSCPGTKKKKTKRTSATEVVREGDKSVKSPSSLPLASRRFFAAGTDPAPHALAQRITAAFPKIAAATLTDSQCLLPNGFIAKVNKRGAVSLTGTELNTPAEFYTRYFDALTRRLDQSFPIRNNSWRTFTKTPTTVQLAIHLIPTHILPDDDEQLFDFIKNPSTMQKRSRLAQPGTLTRAELLGSQSRPLWWSSPLTPTTFPSSSQPSSSSQNGSRSRKRRKPTITPNAPTAIDFDTPMPDAPRSTPPVSTVRFIILVQLIDARSPPAQKEATPGPSRTAAPPPPLTAPTVGMTMMPSQRNAVVHKSPLLNPRPPHLLMKNYRTPTPTVRKPWMWATMANKAHQGNVGAWSTVVLDAPGPPRGVVVPVVHLVQSDPF